MKKPAIILALLLLSIPALYAKELTLVAGLSLPPYFLQQTHNGMEHDIVKETLAQSGYTLKLIFVPFIRLGVEYPKYDGALTINEASGAKGSYSNVVMVYRNYAISLEKSHLSIHALQDLKDKRIIAFQNATTYLGSAYKAIVQANPRYKETANQESQVKMLYSGRTDAVVMDKNIFQYYRKQIFGGDTGPEAVYHELFAGSEYKVLFNDPAVRDLFNKALAQLKSSGRYQEIINSYLK